MEKLVRGVWLAHEGLVDGRRSRHGPGRTKNSVKLKDVETYINIYIYTSYECIIVSLYPEGSNKRRQVKTR